jgi:hypothetical protein
MATRVPHLSPSSWAAVAICGKRARRSAACIGLLGLTLTGCGDAPSIAAPGGQVRTAESSQSQSSQSSLTLCPARPDTSLNQALARSAPTLAPTFAPFSLSPDGRTVYAAVQGPDGLNELAAINDSTWTIVSHHPLGGADDVALAGGQGPWIAYDVYPSAYNQTDFTVYAWNTVTGQVRKLGGSIKGAQGTWPSPWWYPAASGQYAAWTVGDGPGSVDKVMLADLATGQESAVYQGHALEPFFYDGLLVWPQSAQAQGITQGVTTLMAINVSSGKPASLPLALQGSHAQYNIVTSGGQVAYIVPPAYNELYYSAAPGQPSRVVLTQSGAQTFTDVEVGPGWIGWTTNATYLANTRTGAYVKVTPQWGDLTGTNSPVIVIGDYVSKKDSHPPEHLLDPASLTWPSCAKG